MHTHDLPGIYNLIRAIVCYQLEVKLRTEMITIDIMLCFIQQKYIYTVYINECAVNKVPS